MLLSDKQARLKKRITTNALQNGEEKKEKKHWQTRRLAKRLLKREPKRQKLLIFSLLSCAPKHIFCNFFKNELQSENLNTIIYISIVSISQGVWIWYKLKRNIIMKIEE